MHFNQVAKWRRRYIRGGLGVLQDSPRSARKGSLSTELLRQIVVQATRPPQGRAQSAEVRPGLFNWDRKTSSNAIAYTVKVVPSSVSS
jgi:hypothetical protein